MRRKAYRPIKKCFQGMEQTNSEYMRIYILWYVSIYLKDRLYLSIAKKVPTFQTPWQSTRSMWLNSLSKSRSRLGAREGTQKKDRNLLINTQE